MRAGKERLEKTLDLYVKSFEKILYEEDRPFIESMKAKGLEEKEILRYQYWEWTQGVGLYGFWKMYKEYGRKECMDQLVAYYDRQLSIGFPARNVNTTAPLLTMSFVAEELGREDYLQICREWADWIMTDFPRTREGGFQHMTSDSRNDQQLWDDTLFMTVLFLANMGRILQNTEYLEEAEYQFLIHIKYLTDRATGLWYHGWTFEGNHNFAKAPWGRGNCWVTAAIPDFLEMTGVKGCVGRYLEEVWRRQVESLAECQDERGMWHTLLDDDSSYPEASATCGFGYGILKGIHTGILGREYTETALRAMDAILDYTDEDGVLGQVSYGTAMGSSRQFYKDIPLKPMPYGQALAMLYLLEAMKELEDGGISASIDAGAVTAGGNG